MKNLAATNFEDLLQVCQDIPRTVSYGFDKPDTSVHSQL